jgi:hypothetical protein
VLAAACLLQLKKPPCHPWMQQQWTLTQQQQQQQQQVSHIWRGSSAPCPLPRCLMQQLLMLLKLGKMSPWLLLHLVQWHRLQLYRYHLMQQQQQQ